MALQAGRFVKYHVWTQLDGRSKGGQGDKDCRSGVFVCAYEMIYFSLILYYISFMVNGHELETPLIYALLDYERK